MLKEMVKSANLEVRAKEIDITKLKNRLARESSQPRNHSAVRQRSAVSQEPPLSGHRGARHSATIKEADEMYE